MIKTLRDQLINDLKTGSDGAVTPTSFPVYGPWPDRIGPPCFVVGIEPGQYVTAGQVFQSFEVAMTVVVFVKKSSTYLEELEAMIEYVLSNTVDWGLQGVDAPTAVSEAGMELLGAAVHIAKQSKL